LLEDAVEGARCQVIARLAGDGDTSRLARVFELPMTTALSHLLPPIGLKHAQHLADLHGVSIAARCDATLSSPHEARVTELVDVGGLKPPAARRMGSIPIPRTRETFETNANMTIDSKDESAIRQKLLDALIYSDARRRLERVKRIEWLSANRRPLGGMAGRSQILALHGEAIHCYVDGRFVATTLTATAFVEQAVVDALLERQETSRVQIGAQEALDLAAQLTLLRPALVRRVRALIKRRNAYSHLKVQTNRYSFDRRFWAAKVHPDRIRESDAKKALQVMDAVLHATLN
jgi:hypothetical protein